MAAAAAPSQTLKLPNDDLVLPFRTVRSGVIGRLVRLGPAVDEITGTDRKRFLAAVAILEFHPPALDAHHRADEAGLSVLDDHADLDRQLNRTGSFLVRIGCEDIRAIAISHRVIVGSAPCC